MLGLGLASSHEPALFEPKEMWPLIYSRTPASTKDSQPHTAKLETPEVIQGYIDRIHVAFEVLRQQLQAYRPEALIVVGDDQGDMFNDRLNPTFCIFTGEKLWGLDGTNYRPLAERHQIDFPCHATLAQYLHKGLLKKGFDMASGGLSHDPTGPRAGWVDEPLDRWFLERLERNDSEALKHLFTFDSETLRGGTGEMRAWITVAGAMRRPAKVIEYIASNHAKVGLGFACWPAVDASCAV
jgi:hypothetical protein